MIQSYALKVKPKEKKFCGSKQVALKLDVGALTLNMRMQVKASMAISPVKG
jgi:hypothetical protein